MMTSTELPQRRRRDGRWTPVYEPGPVRRCLGWLSERFGFLLWWV